MAPRSDCSAASACRLAATGILTLAERTLADLAEASAVDAARLFFG